MHAQIQGYAHIGVSAQVCINNSWADKSGSKTYCLSAAESMFYISSPEYRPPSRAQSRTLQGVL